MKKRSVSSKVVVLMLALAMVISTCSCSKRDSNSDDLQKEIDELLEDNKDLKAKKNAAESELKEAKQDLEEAQSDLSQAQSDLEKVQSEASVVSSQYESYKESMSEYEELAEDEKEARIIEASRIQAEEDARKESEAEESRKQAEKEAKESEEKEKKGYDTGITYDQLARTPDDYKGEKVKFKGKVIQVVEGDGDVTLRVAINSDYDKIILVYYESNIVSSRVLEDDIITLYGKSGGLYTYDSTMGGKITIPLVYVEKIDQ